MNVTTSSITSSISPVLADDIAACLNALPVGQLPTGTSIGNTIGMGMHGITVSWTDGPNDILVYIDASYCGDDVEIYDRNLHFYAEWTPTQDRGNPDAAHHFTLVLPDDQALSHVTACQDPALAADMIAATLPTVASYAARGATDFAVVGTIFDYSDDVPVA